MSARAKGLTLREGRHPVTRYRHQYQPENGRLWMLVTPDIVRDFLSINRRWSIQYVGLERVPHLDDHLSSQKSNPYRHLLRLKHPRVSQRTSQLPIFILSGWVTPFRTLIVSVACRQCGRMGNKVTV